MEPTTIFFIFLALALVVMFISSSNEDEHQSPREETDRHSGQFYPRPDYPMWGSPPDWRDWQYDYYRRPRIYRVSSVFKAVGTTFMACLILMAGVYIFTKVESNPSPTIADVPKDLPAENPDPSTLRVQKRKAVIKAPTKAYVLQPYHLCAKSSPLDLATARQIKKLYTPLEILQIDEDLCNLVVFTDNSEALDKFVNILRSDERLKPYTLDFKFRKVTDLCSGKIIRENGTDIWFCQE